jgi:DNA-directed RNA polymerase specialized sigma24 family protein
MNSKNVPEQSKTFEEHFSRHRKLLYFLACRVLGNAEGAEEAVQNCFLTSSRNPPSLACESEFGSWLLRRLIEEALLLRHYRLRRARELSEAECQEALAFGTWAGPCA